MRESCFPQNNSLGRAFSENESRLPSLLGLSSRAFHASDTGCSFLRRTLVAPSSGRGELYLPVEITWGCLPRKLRSGLYVPSLLASLAPRSRLPLRIRQFGRAWSRGLSARYMIGGAMDFGLQYCVCLIHGGTGMDRLGVAIGSVLCLGEERLASNEASGGLCQSRAAEIGHRKDVMWDEEAFSRALYLIPRFEVLLLVCNCLSTPRQLPMSLL